MKLNRVENSSQKKYSETAEKITIKIDNHSQKNLNNLCIRERNQKAGVSACMNKSGAINTLITTKSNHKPLMKISGQVENETRSMPV